MQSDFVASRLRIGERGAFAACQGLTLRELLWMAEARGRESWSHTSATLALIANVNP